MKFVNLDVAKDYDQLVVNLDVAKDYDQLVALLKEEKADVVIHFAEQRAAPYSQKNSKTKRYTVDNNVGGTNNLLAAVVDSDLDIHGFNTVGGTNLLAAVIDSDLDIHVIHLGTMGVYGYGTSGGEIPEGYLK
ncbi:hypothetical protein T484DRAFT_1806710, partial [Baffinella frigidus]